MLEEMVLILCILRMIISRNLWIILTMLFPHYWKGLVLILQIPPQKKWPNMKYRTWLILDQSLHFKPTYPKILLDSHFFLRGGGESITKTILRKT
jgi:hypothetical protein